MADARDIYSPAFVRDVFDRTSKSYIWVSTIASMGFTEIWRRQCVAILPKPPSDAPIMLDLMAGTGEVWSHLLRRFPNIAKIHAVDISEGMHQRALQRLHTMRANRIAFVCDNVLESQLADASADSMISTFGLKTFNQDQQAQLAALIARVLKPGGGFALIEASDPKGWWLRGAYTFYMIKILPLVERFILNGAQDFSMIGTYCANFGDASHMADQLRAQGLEVQFKRHFFGCATSVSGFKPF